MAFSAYLYFSFARDLHEELQRALASEADRLIANIELESGHPQFGEGSDNLADGHARRRCTTAPANLLEAADPRQCRTGALPMAGPVLSRPGGH